LIDNSIFGSVELCHSADDQTSHVYRQTIITFIVIISNILIAA